MITLIQGTLVTSQGTSGQVRNACLGRLKVIDLKRRELVRRLVLTFGARLSAPFTNKAQERARLTTFCLQKGFPTIRQSDDSSLTEDSQQCVESACVPV